MKKPLAGLIIPWILPSLGYALAEETGPTSEPPVITVTSEVLLYHPIRTDASGRIISWVSADPATSYDRVIRLVWAFWKGMEVESNGLWYYMNHQVMNEQTAYRVPGNSHTSRQASMELVYCEKTGDLTTKANAICALNWATYMVAGDGRNRYFHDDIWRTDGYGDYVRHFLRAMAAAPELAPANADHLLRTSSTVTRIAYDPNAITYSLFDPASQDVLRLTARPRKVTVDGKALDEVPSLEQMGWLWQAMDKGGVLRIRQDLGQTVRIER